MRFTPPSAWFSALMSFLQKEVWTGHEATSLSQIKSLKETQGPIEVCFRNVAEETVVICWVDHAGALHHFYQLPPLQEHIEHSAIGDAFVVIACDDPDSVNEQSLQDPNHSARMVGAYRSHANSCFKSPLIEIQKKSPVEAPCSFLARNKKRKQDDPEWELHLSDIGPIGTVWMGAQEASRAKSLSDVGGQVRICFRNKTDEPVILCWVDGNGKPHHFYKLEPYVENPSEDEDLILGGDHVETSRVGHAFLFATKIATPEHMPESCLIGAYRAIQTKSSLESVHLLELSKQSSASKRVLRSCQPCSSTKWNLSAKWSRVDPTPLDTTCKTYRSTFLAGWPVMVEENWHGGDKELEELLKQDLKHMSQCLPRHACRTLRVNTPIWINRTLKYGPAAFPVSARGMCYHPDDDWLKEQKMHVEKCHGVELYNSTEYKDDRCLWGKGGLLIHEFSHAYHDKCVQDGYKNKDILDCYNAAMKEGLYDCVPVHGTQGPKCKAYACDNAMEYFAELSTAFLGGKDGDEEFNKWFPFNRKQIKEHDPRAYEMLKRIWKE